MKSVLAIASTLALAVSAQLSYDLNGKSFECPVASGKFCVGPAAGLIVTCTGGIGTIAPCGGIEICRQTSATAGDATCSTSAGSSNSTGPWIIDSESEDCDCDDEPVTPPPSSTPVAPVLPSSRYANTSTPCTTTTTTPVHPVIPPTTPVAPITPVIPPTTPVAPITPATKPTSHLGTGTGYPHHTSNGTTLNSSWRPTLTASSSGSSSTIAAPIAATDNAAAGGNNIPALAVGLAALIAVLV